MRIEKIYERVYASLEARGWLCPTCEKGARLHNLNVVPTGETYDIQLVCRYNPDGFLKEVFRRCVACDKEMLRESFGNIRLADGQRLEAFVAECRNDARKANRMYLHAREFEARIETALRRFADSLGVPTSSRGQACNVESVLMLLDANITHMKKRMETTRKQALGFYAKNQELAQELKRVKVSARKQNAESKPQLRVVGSPPPIPTTKRPDMAEEERHEDQEATRHRHRRTRLRRHPQR